MVGTTAAHAEAYTLWCEGNTTLYFLNSDEMLTAGGMHDGQVITNVWKGDEVAVQKSSSPVWEKVAKQALTRVVFEESFKTVKPISCCYWFAGCRYLKSIVGLSEGYLDTSNVWTMYQMFSGCYNLESLDVSKFDTGAVTIMAAMFLECRSLTSLDVSHFNTSRVVDMSGMFGSCKFLTSLDLSSFDTSKVTNAQSMFDTCSGLTSLDLGNFDTRQMTTMREMFGKCSSLTSLDLSSFCTSNVNDMYAMFNQCTELTDISVGDGWDVSNVVNSDNFFYLCERLVGQDGTTYDNNTPYDKTRAHYGEGGYLRYKDPAGVMSVNRDDKSVRYYDLRGHCVKRPVKGVYIVDGKKVVTTNAHSDYE